MKILVDADACPVMVREVLYKAANRTHIPAVFVANQLVRVPNSPYLSAVQVESGFDVADNEIVRRCQAGDLVITADLPLAAEVIEKGGLAINPRGDAYTPENIKPRLNMRDFMDTMRASGVHTGGPPPLNPQDKQRFANQLDRLLTSYIRGDDK